MLSDVCLSGFFLDEIGLSGLSLSLSADVRFLRPTEFSSEVCLDALYLALGGGSIVGVLDHCHGTILLHRINVV